MLHFIDIQLADSSAACTLSNLSRFLSRKKEELLIEILDFLVELMQHKEKNLMDAYHLGEAMGKVTLGPTDCDPIIAEKANHFLTRMIIEHSKRLHSQHKRHSVSRPDSGFVQSPKQQQQHQQTLKFSSIDLCNESAYYELRPMSKTEAARAKAKSYDRHIRKIRTSSSDWVANTVGIRAMLDDDYEPEQVEPQEPWIPIFTTQLDQYDPIASPLIYRIVSEASKPKLPIPVDPFASSYLFRKNNVVEAQVSHAFSEFASLCTITYDISDKTGKQTNVSHLKKINHSLSNMKLNLRKHRSQAALESQFSNDETLREEDEDAVSADQQRKPIKQQQHHHVKNMMRRVIRMSALPANNKHAAPQPMS